MSELAVDPLGAHIICQQRDVYLLEREEAGQLFVTEGRDESRQSRQSVKARFTVTAVSTGSPPTCLARLEHNYMGSRGGGGERFVDVAGGCGSSNTGTDDYDIGGSWKGSCGAVIVEERGRLRMPERGG